MPDQTNRKSRQLHHDSARTENSQRVEGRASGHPEQHVLPNAKGKHCGLPREDGRRSGIGPHIGKVCGACVTVQQPDHVCLVNDHGSVNLRAWPGGW
jgi:hypothetical protein